MSVLNRELPPKRCPRCGMALLPGGSICATCGFQTAEELAGVPTKPLRPSRTPTTGKNRTHRQNRPALLYFTSMLLLLIVTLVVALHSAGVSLPAFFPKGSPPSKVVSYPLPKGTPLFADSFVSDAAGWNLQSAPGNYAVTLGNGTLSLQADKHHLLWELVPGERTFGNVTLAVNAQLAEGDPNNGYGVYMRGASDQASDLATYYRFELYGDGSYAIFKGIKAANGTSIATKIVNYTLSPAIRKQGALNRIMILARGAALSLVVNGQLLRTITDASYASGSIALFVSNLPEARPGAEAQFSQLALYPN